MHTIDVIDSHTAGEPTRVVLSGFPDLGDGDLAQCRERFRSEFDQWRSAIACEPRGSDTMVGALLLPPRDPSACTGVIFFNNVGYLGMCGHGTIGVVRTLATLGRIAPGQHSIETPVGTVGVELAEDGTVSVDNVESYRFATGVEVDVPGHGRVCGDVAWGGNWFFITEQAPCVLDLAHQRELTAYTEAIRLALEAAGITGEAGGEIDHIEVNGPAPDASGLARNFVLCPEPGLRPLAVRHRHQRQTGLPGRRRQAGRGRALGAARHSGQHVRRQLSVEWAWHCAAHQRACLRYRALAVVDRPGRPVRLGHRGLMHQLPRAQGSAGAASAASTAVSASRRPVMRWLHTPLPQPTRTHRRRQRPRDAATT